MTWSVLSSTSCPSIFCPSNSHLRSAIFQRLHHHKLPKSTNPWPPESLNFCFSQRRMQICRAAVYKFPDPIPEFALTETEKFRSYLQKKLGKKDLFGDSLEEVLGICTEAYEYEMGIGTHQPSDHNILYMKDDLLSKITRKLTPIQHIMSTFMHTEYGGPGTLLVIPFIDMADTLEERDLPGGPQAARAAIKWARDNVDKDWKEWTQGGN